MFFRSKCCWLLLIALFSLASFQGIVAMDDPLITVDPKYNTAVELHPSDPRVYLDRGNAWRELEQFEHALADYSMALELKHDYADALFHRGLTWRMQREYDRALADYNYLIQLHPKDVDALNNRAVVWSLKGNFYQAFANLDQALRIDLKNSLAKSNRDLLKKRQAEYSAFPNEGDLPELEESFDRNSVPSESVD